MALRQYSLQFQGFHPSDYAHEYIDAHMKELQIEAHGATLKASFKRNQQDLKAVVSLHSKAGRIVAVATGRKMRDVCKKVMDQIRRQLQRRKEVRRKWEISDEIVP